ncbi:hypothetical protein SDC9_99103 [bioreactor metagenome]|uniref:SH3b domain-containing protein n=1 Tax=bioreactor metagenome TaxID=1076179 RepID=A0A645ARX4_9ZZZZ
MKTLKIISVVALWLLSFAALAQSVDPAAEFEKANALYNAKKYEEATQEYNDLLRSGYISDEVYFNLGNACFRNNDAASAIWCYEKCLLLNAAHQDAQANLDFVNKTALGNPEKVPENFFRYAWNSIYALMSWRCWTFTFIITLALFLAAAIAFLISASNRNRRLLFFSSVLLLMATLLSLAQSISGNYNIKHSRNAIVVHEAAQMKSSPDSTRTAIAMIQPGIKVHILENRTPWLKVIAPDGTQGWVLEDRIVRLNAVTPLPVN